MTTVSNSLKQAMLVYAPELESDYKSFVVNIFSQMQKDLGPCLKGVYNSPRWARTFRNIRMNVKHGDKPVMTMAESMVTPYRIDNNLLSKNAKEYGIRTSLEWYNKMVSKIGELGNVTVSEPNREGSVIISGSIGANSVVIEQNRIINVSSLGTLFHQFPARIYVNGNFMSEREYKKMLLRL